MIDGTGRLGYYWGMTSPAEWYIEREELAHTLIGPLPLALLGAGALLLAIERWSKDHGVS